MENIRVSYCLLSPAVVEQYWSIVAPWILQAVAEEPLPMEVDYIRCNALRGQSYIFIAYKGEQKEIRPEDIEAVLVTEPAFYLEMKTLICRWLSGKSESATWVEHLNFLETWASQQGFQRVELWCSRKGWERVFKSYGYVHESTHLGKFLRRSTH